MANAPPLSIRFAIDRGGTYTDIYAEVFRNTFERRHRDVIVTKLLSVDPGGGYSDAPTEGIRRVLQRVLANNNSDGNVIGVGGKIKVRDERYTVQSIRMGTTVATNALLEGRGEKFVLIVTKGFGDVLKIGSQARKELFNLAGDGGRVLWSGVVEVEERVVVKRESQGLEFEVEKTIDVQELEKQLKEARTKWDVKAAAVVLLHSYGFQQHEKIVEEVAAKAGFEHVSVSSSLAQMVKMVPRGFTACVDAYLTPKTKEYIQSFRQGFVGSLTDVDVKFMQSDGGLCNVDDFTGYRAILSGPAGGVVGYGRTVYEKTPVIGFDMGGTSTDVSRYSGRLEHVFETEISGIAIQAPQIDIHTVAAGGGSRLSFRAGLYYVGPESVGAHPGPLCYGKGGKLSVTDANLVLGRVVPEFFPKNCGPNANEPLYVDATRRAFEQLTMEINAASKGGVQKTVEEVALGFVDVANETMCRPIRTLTEAKGHDIREHVLACFGGAGGQHACAVARSLGMPSVVVHRHSGILSAYGIALADTVVDRQIPIAAELSDSNQHGDILRRMSDLETATTEELLKRGIRSDVIYVERFLNLRYEGTDFAIMVLEPERFNELGFSLYQNTFVALYQKEYGFTIPKRPILIDNLRVRAVGKSDLGSMSDNDKPLKASATASLPAPTSALIKKCFFSGWLETPVFCLHDLLPDSKLPSPCLVVEPEAGITVVVDPQCVAEITDNGDVRIQVHDTMEKQKPALASGTSNENPKGEDLVDRVLLSVFAHRFMSIAEQMGRVLQRTAISTNIKERLDFSCAVFDSTGGLVANAPHVPVHLGAMQDAVRAQIRRLGLDWKPGQVILSNHPQMGGTHLPDLTVITPVFDDVQDGPGAVKPVFFVASRGHHADIGGLTPGSMPPFSKSLAEEGLAVESFLLAEGGIFAESELRLLLSECGCRRPSDVIADLGAQVAANTKGVSLIHALIGKYGHKTTFAYMHHIQSASCEAVQESIIAIAREHSNSKSIVETVVSDQMDDGSMIKLKLNIDQKLRHATFDFTGTAGYLQNSNLNAPRAITYSAIIYVLRCLVSTSIPLNEGCLKPTTIIIPKGSMLDPPADAAVVGGNVLTSQRIVDVVLKAFEVCAASYGCMNNFTFGQEGFGYYETIGGGHGATRGHHGASGLQAHMTNTRITDVEILEQRYPVLVRRFGLRQGSGGVGQWNGGEGVERWMEFREKVIAGLLTERRVFAPYGIDGGGDGALGENWVKEKNGVDEKRVGGKWSGSVEAGGWVRILTPGGGGVGNAVE